MLKIFTYSLILLIASLIWAICLWPDQNLHVIFCDVGQGDAILIQYQFTQLLIDAGKNEQVLSCLNQFMPKWDKHLEYVLITHDDSDHIGGLEAVLESYNFGQILVEKSSKIEDFSLEGFSNEDRQLLLKQMKKPIFDQKIILSDIFYAKVISHLESSLSANQWQNQPFPETTLSDETSIFPINEKDNNDLSIVLSLEAKQKSFLFTGDLSEKGELALIKQNLLGKTNVLKVGHHGSKTSTSRPFLQLIQPEIAIISSGKNNQFGHPHSQVLKNLEKIGAQILQTSKVGHIELVTDGEKIWWRQ